MRRPALFGSSELQTRDFAEDDKHLKLWVMFPWNLGFKIPSFANRMAKLSG